MKTENRIIELKAAAVYAKNAEIEAENSRYLAWLVCKPNSDKGITPNASDWELYRAADEVFMDACADSKRAAIAYFTYRDHLDGINSTDNTED